MDGHYGDYTVRQGTLEDKDALFNLCRGIQSLKALSNDNIVTRFSQYLDDKNTNVYIVHHQSQMVACIVLWSNTKMKTIQCCDVRVSGAHTDSINSLTNKLMESDAASHVSWPTMLRVASVDDAQRSSTQSKISERVSLLFPLYRYFRSGPRVVETYLKKNQPDAMSIMLTELSTFEQRNIVMDKNICKRLFPDGKVFLNNILHEVGEDILHIARQQYPDMYSSKDSSGSYRSLSLGVRMSSADDRGWLYDMHYHGDTDMTLLLAHVYKHTQCAFQEPIRLNVNFNILLSPEFGEKYSMRGLRQNLARTFSTSPEFVRIHYLQASILQEGVSSKI